MHKYLSLYLVFSLWMITTGSAATQNTPVITFTPYSVLTADELNTMQKGLVPANNGISSNQTLSLPVITGGSLVNSDISLAKVTPIGSGTASNLNAFMSTIPNVVEYGAVGDGTTDDGSAVSAAITQAGSNGTVIFPYRSNGYIVNTGNFSGGKNSIPGKYMFNGNNVSGSAIGDPGYCFGTIQSPALQTCLKTVYDRYVLDPAGVYQTSGTTNIGISVDCLPNKQNPNSAISGDLMACWFLSADTGNNSDAATKNYGTEIDNKELFLGTSAGSAEETDIQLYEQNIAGGINRWEFALAGMDSFSDELRAVTSGANVWGKGVGWALDIEATGNTLPSTSYSVVSTSPSDTQVQLSGTTNAYTLTFANTITKGYTVYCYLNNNLISQTYIDNWSTKTVTVNTSETLSTSNTTVVVGVVPSYSSPSGTSTSSQATYILKNGSYTFYPRWDRAIMIDDAKDDIFLTHRILGENGTYLRMQDANFNDVYWFDKEGAFHINSTSNSNSGIQFSQNGSYTAYIGSLSDNAFFVADNTQSGVPWAITLINGKLSLGETGKTVSITGNLVSPTKTCLDTTCTRYIYEHNSKVYIGNTTNGDVFSIDDSGNVIAKGTVTASSTP